MQRGKLRGQPLGDLHGGGKIDEFEAWRAADELSAAASVGATTTIDDIEGVLHRGDERALGGGERHDEIAIGVTTADTDRTGDTERDLREADEALDAAGKLLGLELGGGTAQGVNGEAILTQTRTTCIARVAGGVGRRGQASRAAAGVFSHRRIVSGSARGSKPSAGLQPLPRWGRRANNRRMHPLPHLYVVSAAATVAGPVSLESSGLPTLASEPPVEFGGPGGRWSPETLLTAALVDCFVLSFRAVASASRFEWSALECRAEGTLDRIERVTQFTAFKILARLRVPAGADQDRARKLLEKAEQVCLISSSLKASKHLEIEIVSG